MNSFASFYWDVACKREAQEDLIKILTHAMQFLYTTQSNEALIAFYQPPVVQDGQQPLVAK
ncbi:MAG: hypothetical protein P4M11_13565 [Candidatus Pacebacteria bacterium]|nr:hypothetical protein [Candidatus Paceibacterota bacterium]